nr:ATP-binding protein [Motilibacter aurantiacus]
MQVRDAQDLVATRFFAATIASTESFTNLVDAETAVRGYALTANPADLEPLTALTQPETQSEVTKRRLEILRDVVDDDPELQASYSRASEDARRWFREWAQPVIESVRLGGPTAVSTDEIERGRDLFDTLRTDYNSYLAVLQDRRTEAREDLRTQTDLLFVAVITSALVAFGVALALWYLLQRWVTRPVGELAAETRVVRSGNLRHAVVGTGPPEFVALGQDVDVMRRGLVAQLEEVERARGEIEDARTRLEEQAQDLQRSNRELEQFAYVASHDLQEPLRKVASFCQMLERRYKGQLDERADQYIAFAVDGAKRMQQLINDLLAFSRVGRMSSGQTEVDLDTCLRNALRNLSSAIEESGAQVTSDPLPTVRGEGPLLTQVFQNLVGNAVKFRGEAAPQVHIGVRREGDVWELCCRDNGIGIEPQYAERIFVIFQRLHPKDEYEGTGIGLALCRKIVEFHGGRIWIDTEQTGASGTTFRWTLPALPEDPANQTVAMGTFAGASTVQGETRGTPPPSDHGAPALADAATDMSGHAQ